MIGLTWTEWRTRLFLLGSAAVLATIGVTTASPPAQARGWVSVGLPFPGYAYGPDPYYAYPSPYYYAPQTGYYYPPPGGAYPPAAAAPSAYVPDQPAYAYPAPAAYPQPAPGYAPVSTAPIAASPAGTPPITYTSKPAFTNSAGQTCRQYKATDTSGGRAADVYGTACRQGDGQWRVVN